MTSHASAGRPVLMQDSLDVTTHVAFEAAYILRDRFLTVEELCSRAKPKQFRGEKNTRFRRSAG